MIYNVLPLLSKSVSNLSSTNALFKKHCSSNMAAMTSSEYDL